MTIAGMIDPAILLLAGIILTGFSGVPGILPRIGALISQKSTTVFACLGSISGMTGATAIAAGGTTRHYVLDWSLPFDPCVFNLDPLAALFLLPVFLIFGACAVYAHGYWPAIRHGSSSRSLGFFLGILTASMALLVIAANSVFFLISWEVMAIAAYFAITADNEDPEVRQAGFTYLVCTHVGTLGLFILFITLRISTGSFLFPPAGILSPYMTGAPVVFFTALLGFGMKAGIMPLHLWLPAAHANGPSHVSAIMSGVMLKMGIYGMIRIISMFSPVPLWWGIVILCLGIISGLAGVIAALGQQDIKRLLAYSSIENIGIITIAFGTSLVGYSQGNQALLAMGMAGCLLHVLNHALFKSLLFLGSGSIIHAAGSRDLSQMGGLARHMPYTSFLFFIGCCAICGLPPLNGFISEYVLYLGFFTGIAGTGTTTFLTMGLAVFSLALIGSLALACFVRLAGIAFLGQSRSRTAETAHEAPATMVLPMALLATGCVAGGVMPLGVLTGVEPAILATFPTLPATVLDNFSATPLGMLQVCFLFLGIAIGALALFYRRQLKSGLTASSATWGCGYLQPSATTQYSATSFAEMLVHFFRGLLQPVYLMPRLSGFTPASAQFSSRIPETILEYLLLPFMKLTGTGLSFLRRLQHGEPNLYVLYIFITLVLLLVWSY